MHRTGLIEFGYRPDRILSSIKSDDRLIPELSNGCVEMQRKRLFQNTGGNSIIDSTSKYWKFVFTVIEKLWFKSGNKCMSVEFQNSLSDQYKVRFPENSSSHSLPNEA